ASVAGALGLALAAACVRLFAYSVSGINFAYWYNERWTMDGRVFGFAAALCLGTSFAFGLIPALQLSKTDMNDDLKQDMSTGAGGSFSSASIVSTIPFIGAPMWQLAVIGRPPVQTPPRVSFVLVGTRYFETLELHLVRGRAFSESDGSPGHESAVVTQQFVDI